MRDAAPGLWLIFVGLFFTVTAVIDMGRFFEGRGSKKPLFFDRLGRQGSRVFYGAAGVMCVLAGILITAVMKSS